MYCRFLLTNNIIIIHGELGAIEGRAYNTRWPRYLTSLTVMNGLNSILFFNFVIIWCKSDKLITYLSIYPLPEILSAYKDCNRWKILRR